MASDGNQSDSAEDSDQGHRPKVWANVQREDAGIGSPQARSAWSVPAGEAPSYPDDKKKAFWDSPYVKKLKQIFTPGKTPKSAEPSSDTEAALRPKSNRKSKAKLEALLFSRLDSKNERKWDIKGANEQPFQKWRSEHGLLALAGGALLGLLLGLIIWAIVFNSPAIGIHLAWHYALVGTGIGAISGASFPRSFVDFFLNVWGVLKEIKRLMSTAIIISVYYQASDKSDHSSADNPQSPRPSDQIPQKFTLPNAPSSETKKRLSYSPPTQELERKPSSPEISPGPLSESRAEGSEAAATDTQATPDHVRDAMEVENLLAKQFRWRFFALWGSQLPVPHLPLKKMDNNPGATWRHLVNPGLFGFTKKTKKDLKDDINAFERLTLFRSKPRGDKRNDFCCALSGSFWILLAGFSLMVLCFAGAHPLIQLILRCLGNPHAGDCKCCHICSLHCFDTQANQFVEGGTSISLLDDWSDGAIGTAEEISNKLFEGLDFMSQDAVCVAPGTQASQTVKTMANAIKHQITATSSAMQELLARGGWSWYVDECDCECDFDNMSVDDLTVVAKSGETEDCSAKLVCECGSGDAESDALCNGDKCTPCPSNAATKSDQQPYCSINVARSSIHMDQNCLSVVELEVETNTPIESLEVHYALFATNQELYQNNSAAGLRHIAAWADTFAEHPCGTRLAAGTWTVEGTDRPRVAHVTGNIAGAPIDFGCLQNSNCSVAGSTHLPTWTGGCSQSLRPDVLYTLALVCEVEFCPECSLGRTQLGRTWEQVITLPELGPARFTDKTAPLNIGTHSFDLNISISKPGRVHWTVLDPEGAADGSSTGSDAQCAGESIYEDWSCIPYDSRRLEDPITGQLQVDKLEERAAHVWGTVPWCQDCTGSCSVPERAQDAGAWADIPYGGHSPGVDVLCSGWDSKAIMQAAAANGSSDASPLPAAAGFGCMSFRPVAGGAVDVQTSTLVQVLPRCVPDGDTCASATSPPTSDCPHRQMLERCHTYVVCMTVQKDAARDAATTTAASCSEDTAQEEELAPTRCFTVTTACHNPWVDIRGWRADAGSLTIPFGGLEGESLPVYWMLEKQFVSSPGPSCDGLFNLDGSPYALRLGSTTVVDCATAHTASQTTGCRSTVVAQLAGLTCLETLVHSQLMPGRSVVAAGIVQVHCNAGCDGPPTVHVEGLEPGEEYILSTATVYKRHGCRQAVLHKGEWRLTTADNIPPELMACSLGAKFWSAPETVEVAKVRLEFEVCHVSKDNTAVALAVIQHDADGTLTGGQPAAASLISALSNRTCSDHTGAAPHNLVCSTSSTALGNLQATWPSAACAATGCVQHTCVDGLSVLMDGYAPDAMVPSNLTSCGTYTSLMAFQDKFYNIQPQVTQHSFTAPDTEPPSITHRNRTGGTWFEWQVTPSEQAAMVLLVQEVDTCDNYGLRPSLGEEKLLQAAADEMLDEFLRGPSAPQIISGQLSSCCGGDPVLPSDTSTDLPGGDQIEYPTTTPEPQLGSSTNGTDSTSEGTFAVSSFTGRRRLLQAQAYTLLRTCQASGGSCNTPFLNADNETALVINEMQLNDRQESRLNITNLLEGHNYAVHYLMEDRGSQCGVRSAVGRPLFNRQPGSFCFTTKPNCDPLVTVTRPEGQNCLEVIVTFPAHSSCVISEVLHVVFGEPEPVFGPIPPSVEHVLAASQDDSFSFPWLESNAIRRGLVVDITDNSTTINLDGLANATEYVMYVVGSRQPAAGSSGSLQTSVVTRKLHTQDVTPPKFTGAPALNVLATDMLEITDVGLSERGVLWVGIGCPVQEQEVTCPESFRAAIARTASQVIEDGQTTFRLLHGAAANISNVMCEGGSCQAAIALRAEDGAPLHMIPGSSYTVIAVADDGFWRPKDAPLAWRDGEGCQPAMSEGICPGRLDPNLQTSLTRLATIQAPANMAPPSWCPQQNLTVKVESTDELLLTAFLNETSRITYALIDINLWGADVAQLEAQDLLGCQHSPAEGFLRCLAVKTKDCTNDCALQRSPKSWGCCDTPVYQETIVHPLSADVNLTLCAVAEDLNPGVSQTSSVLCRIVEPIVCEEIPFTREAKPVFTAASSGASFCQGFFAALPPSLLPPSSSGRHASYFPTSRQYVFGASEPTFSAGFAMLPGEVEVGVEIEGVSFATTTVTSWPPVARMRLMVRSMTLHIDYPSTLEVFFALSDAMGRTRVEMDGLALSMSFTPSGGGSIDLGSSACAMSSFDAGVGRCSISLSQIKNACSSCFASTVSATVKVVATYGPESSAVEAAQEVQLAAQPGNTNFITPGAWLQVPQSPRHRCEAFEVIIYGVTGDDPPGQHEDGLQLFDIRLLYDTDILELDTPESDVPAAFQAPYSNDGEGVFENNNRGVMRLLGSMDLNQNGYRGKGTSLPLVRLSFRVRADAAVNQGYPSVLTIEVLEMVTRRAAMGTSASVLDMGGVSTSAAGRAGARLHVAANQPVGMYGYMTPSQDLSAPSSVGAAPLTGSAADLKAHAVMLREFNAGASCGCTLSQCAANQDVSDNSLLQTRLATCTLMHSSSGASAVCANNGVITDAASKLATGSHVLSVTSVEEEGVGFSLSIHVWAAKSITVHAEKSVLRRVDGVPDAGRCNYAYQHSALYAKAVIGGDGLPNVPEVDVSRCVSFSADSSVVELIERPNGGAAAAGRSPGTTAIGIILPRSLSSPPAVASAQVEVSSTATVTVNYIQITAVTGREGFRTQLQLPTAIVVNKQVPAIGVPLSTQFMASVTLRHDLNAAGDEASLFASLHFSDNSTQDISFSSGLAIIPAPNTTCIMAIARQQAGGVHRLVLQPEASSDCGSLLNATWSPCGQPMPGLTVRSSVRCQVCVSSIAASLLKGGCLTKKNSLLSGAAALAGNTVITDRDELVVNVTYCGAPESPKDMSTDERVQIVDADSELIQYERLSGGRFQISAICPANKRQELTTITVCFRQGTGGDDVCDTVTVVLTCYNDQILEALPWPACAPQASTTQEPPPVNCNQPITQLDPLFCPGGPLQRAMLKQYVTQTNMGSCGGRIDVTDDARFPQSPGGDYAVQRLASSWVLIPIPLGATTPSGGVTIDVTGEYGGERATRSMRLGSQGVRQAALVEVLAELHECPPGLTCSTTPGDLERCSEGRTLRGFKGSSYREATAVRMCTDCVSAGACGDPLSSSTYTYCIQGAADDPAVWGWLGGIERFLEFTSSDPAAIAVDASGILTLLDDSTAEAVVTASPKCIIDEQQLVVTPLRAAGNTLPAVGEVDIGAHCGVPVPFSGGILAVPVRLNTGSSRLLVFTMEIDTTLSPRQIIQTTDGCFFWDPKPSQNAGSTACANEYDDATGLHKMRMSIVQVAARPSGAAVSLGTINLDRNSEQVGDTAMTVHLAVVSCAKTATGTLPMPCNFPAASSPQFGASIPMGRKLLADSSRFKSHGRWRHTWSRSRDRSGRTLLVNHPNCVEVSGWRTKASGRRLPAEDGSTVGFCSCELPEFGSEPDKVRFLEWRSISTVFEEAGVDECICDDCARNPTRSGNTIVFHANGQFCVLGDVNGDCVFDTDDVQWTSNDESTFVKRASYETALETVLSSVWRNSQATGDRLSVAEFDLECSESNYAENECRKRIDISRLHQRDIQQKPFLIGAQDPILTSATTLSIATELRSAQGDRIETTDLVVRYEVGASQVFGPMQIDSCSDQVPETSTWPCASPNNNCGAENTALIQINASQSGDGLFRGTLCAGTSDGYPAAGTVAYNVLIEKVASYPAGANHSARYISSQMVASYPAASSCTQDATIPDRDGMLGQYKQQEQRWRPLVSGEIEQDRIDAFDNEACLTSHPNASLHDYAADASASEVHVTFKTKKIDSSFAVWYLVSFGAELPENEESAISGREDCGDKTHQHPLTLGHVCVGTVTVLQQTDHYVTVPVHITHTRWCEAGYCDEEEGLPDELGAFDTCHTAETLLQEDTDGSFSTTRPFSVTTGTYINRLRQNPVVLLWLPEHYSTADSNSDGSGSEGEGGACGPGGSCIYHAKQTAAWGSTAIVPLQASEDRSIVLLNSERGDGDLSQSSRKAYLQLTYPLANVGDWVFVWLYQSDRVTISGGKNRPTLTLRMHTAFKLTSGMNSSFNGRIHADSPCSTAAPGCTMYVELSATRLQDAVAKHCANETQSQACCPKAANSQVDWALTEQSYSLKTSVPKFATQQEAGQFTVQILQRGANLKDALTSAFFNLTQIDIKIDGKHSVTDCESCKIRSYGE